MTEKPPKVWILDVEGSDDPELMFWTSEPGPSWPPPERVTVYVLGARHAEAMERIRLLEDELGAQIRKRSRLLTAAKRLKETEDRWVESGGVEALKEVYAAIAACEGKPDD